MIKINTKQSLKDLKGENLKNGEHDLDIGTVLGITLSGKVSNPTLGYALAKKFSNDKDVELKAEDVVFIKKELEANDQWTALVSGQILEILDGTKEKPTK